MADLVWAMSGWGEGGDDVNNSDLNIHTNKPSIEGQSTINEGGQAFPRISGNGTTREKPVKAFRKIQKSRGNDGASRTGMLFKNSAYKVNPFLNTLILVAHAHKDMYVSVRMCIQ